jgi:formate hydrogenlyase subunit 4
MQNRVGSSVLQPFYDVAKLFGKSETISATASWIFVLAPRIGLAVSLVVAILVPWAGSLLPASWAPATNFILVLYLLALAKFFTMLSAMDTGSSFGGLGASREATISLLVEPTMVICLGAMAIQSGDTDLSRIYAGQAAPIVAVLVGAALLAAAMAELSRMPVDDPTTHLELTMVHEAMILENSGRNLALVELGVALRTCILLGLAAQTLLHAWPAYVDLAAPFRYVIGLGALFALGGGLAIAEGVMVKLKWRSVPHYLAFAGVFGVLAALIVVAQVKP